MIKTERIERIETENNFVIDLENFENRDLEIIFVNTAIFVKIDKRNASYAENSNADQLSTQTMNVSNRIENFEIEHQMQI